MDIKNKPVLKNILLVALAIIIAYLLPRVAPVYLLYDVFFSDYVRDWSFSGFQGLGQYIIGISILYSFLLPLFLVGWGNKHKYWWAVIFFLPIVWIFLADLIIVLFHLIISLVGVGIGFSFNKFLRK